MPNQIDKYYIVPIFQGDTPCYGKCGKGLVAALIDDTLGACIPCTEETCEYLDREMDFGPGEIFDKQIKHLIVRKVKVDHA